MHSAAVTRDVLEVVEGRTCVKFHLLSVTAVSLHAFDQSYESNFDSCDHLAAAPQAHIAAGWTLDQRVEPPRVDITRRGFTSALATVNSPARTTRICAVCVRALTATAKLADRPAADMKISRFTQHTRSKYPHASQVAQRSG